jgi:hypothetical protein
MGILDDPTYSSSSTPKNPKPVKSDSGGKDVFGLGADIPPPVDPNTSIYIGVPDNYLSPPSEAAYGPHYYPSGYNYTHHEYPGGPPGKQRKPIYKQGDQYRPRNADPDSIFATQQALAAMGLLNGPFTGKVWDEPTAAAWEKVLAYANQAGITDEQAMVELGKASAGGRFTVDDKGNVIPLGQADPPPPLITHLTDPKIVKEQFRQAVINLTGTGWDDKRLTAAAQVYNTLERHAQEQDYNARLAGKNTDVVDVPDPQAYMDSYLREHNAADVQEHDALSHAADAFQLLSSPAWGVG